MPNLIELVNQYGRNLATPIIVFSVGVIARLILERKGRLREVYLRAITDVSLLAFALYFGALVATDSRLKIAANPIPLEWQVVLAILFLFMYQVSYKSYIAIRESLFEQGLARPPRIRLVFNLAVIHILGFYSIIQAWMIR